MQSGHIIGGKDAEQWCRQWLPWLLGAGALLLLVRLGSAPVYILDEAKNAQCAREMWWWQRWYIPTFNGALRTDKPPLHYGFMSIAYSLFGVGAWQARLFGAIAGVGLMFIFHGWVRRWSGGVHAFAALACLVLSTHWLFEFRLAVPDPYLIFFTCLGLFATYNYVQLLSSKYLYMAAASLGLAILAKGPVAIALPGLVVLLFIIWQKKWAALTNWQLLPAALLLLLIAMPWYYKAHVATDGAFTQGFFWEHNLQRFSGAMEGHGAPFFVTILVAIVGMLPCSMLALDSLSKRYRYMGQPLYRFSLLAVVAYLVFFSLSRTKLPNYAMPCYPFVAVMAGYLLGDVLKGTYSIRRYIWWVWLLLAAAIPVGAFFAIRAEAVVAPYAFIALLLLPLPLAVGWAWAKREHLLASLAGLAAGWGILAAVVLWVGYPMLYRQNPVTKLLAQLPPEHQLIGYGLYNPAVNFNVADHFKSIIQVFDDPQALRQFLAMHGSSLFSGRQEPIYIITRKENLSQLANLPLVPVFEERDIFELPTTVLLQYQP